MTFSSEILRAAISFSILLGIPGLRDASSPANMTRVSVVAASLTAADNPDMVTLNHPEEQALLPTIFLFCGAAEGLVRVTGVLAWSNCIEYTFSQSQRFSLRAPARLFVGKCRRTFSFPSGRELDASVATQHERSGNRRRLTQHHIYKGEVLTFSGSWLVILALSSDISSLCDLGRICGLLETRLSETVDELLRFLQAANYLRLLLLIMIEVATGDAERRKALSHVRAIGVVALAAIGYKTQQKQNTGSAGCLGGMEIGDRHGADRGYVWSGLRITCRVPRVTSVMDAAI